MIVQTIEISLSKGRAPELLAHLGESNRQIEMIPDVTLPETAGAEIDIVKPDGTFAIQTAAITDGHIIVTLPDQACTVKGLSHYILKITDTGTVIYSAYGNIFVDDHLITDELIESVAEVNGYEFPDDFLTDDNLEANPTGTPTDTLYSLKVGSNIYEVSREVEYSTTEQVIGTWIDGSPLYQLTINVPNFIANQYVEQISKSYYGYLDIATYVPNPSHIFCDNAKSYITLQDTTTRTPIYIDWQGGTDIAIYFPYVARTGTLTLTMLYTKA